MKSVLLLVALTLAVASAHYPPCVRLGHAIGESARRGGVRTLSLKSCYHVCVSNEKCKYYTWQDNGGDQKHATDCEIILDASSIEEKGSDGSKWHYATRECNPEAHEEL